MIAYLDTSVLTRRYLPEPGSSSIHALLRSNRRIAVSRLTFAETCAAVGRAHTKGLIEAHERDAIIDRLPEDFAELWVIEPRKAIIESVAELIKRHPLRGYDALQLASCLKVRSHEATELWAADGALIAAARAEGLKVVAL